MANKYPGRTQTQSVYLRFTDALNNILSVWETETCSVKVLDEKDMT